MTRLICFDMDGVLFEHGNFWVELHKAFGTWEEGKQLTQQYLNTNYPKLVEEVIGRLWKGKDAKIYYELINKQKYLPNVKQTIKKLKERSYKIAILSSGPSDLAERAKQELGINYFYTNKLLIRNGKIAGSADLQYWPIRAGNKAEALKELCQKNHLQLKDVIPVGHEENDIKMCRITGLGIALNSESEELKKYCSAIINGSIDKIIPIIQKFENNNDINLF